MRVLHIGKYYPPAPGGMERVLQLLCDRERRTIDSRVLVAGHEPVTRRETIRGVPVTRAATFGRIGSVGLAPTLPLELRRAEADLLVLHEPNPVALVADWLARTRTPLVVYFHSEVVRAEWKYRALYRPFLARVLDRADRILVASPSMAEGAVQLERFRNKCAVVPYGIELDALAPTPAVMARAAEIRARHPGPLVLFVGRLVPYKGVSVLIDAVQGTNVTSLIVGGGPLAGQLREQASRLPNPRQVVFAGEVDDAELLACYHACDALVLPSVTRAEAFGMVQLEAMACGKPVISTDLPSGVPWVNRHGESGLVVPPDDAASLRAALERLTGDPALRSRLGTGARARVETEFTAAVMARRTIAVYETALGRAVAATPEAVAVGSGTGRPW